MKVQETLFAKKPPRQFLKWIGNKQRFAEQIISHTPLDFGLYIEPFVGSGAVLGALAPKRAVAGDIYSVLIELWRLLQNDPNSLEEHYGKNRDRFMAAPRETYEAVKQRYNNLPNPHDLLFICRSCYGGVVRFRKKDGFISTPVGPHKPIPTESLRERMHAWRSRIAATKFVNADFADTMGDAKKGDLVYCDPPYVYSQAILYGAQAFRLEKLWHAIEDCRRRGVFVMLSIDGHKKSGTLETDISPPEELFKRQIMIDCGRSMLRRFQREGETLEDEVVHDRLLLTW